MERINSTLANSSDFTFLLRISNITDSSLQSRQRYNPLFTGFRKKIVSPKSDETELSFTINGDDSLVTSSIPHKVRNINSPSEDDSETIKLLESWLNEEVTVEGEKSWLELEKALDENYLSFD